MISYGAKDLLFRSGLRLKPFFLILFLFLKPVNSENILRILTVVLANNIKGRSMILKIEMNSFRSGLKQKKTKNGEITEVMLWAKRSLFSNHTFYLLLS
jgi:hypothetical protein